MICFYLAKKDIIIAFCLHELRHSYALLSLENGDDIKTLQQNMGHSTISTTLDVYGHVSEQMKKESAARMDARIETLLR